MQYLRILSSSFGEEDFQRFCVKLNMLHKMGLKFVRLTIKSEGLASLHCCAYFEQFLVRNLILKIFVRYCVIFEVK